MPTITLGKKKSQVLNLELHLPDKVISISWLPVASWFRFSTSWSVFSLSSSIRWLWIPDIVQFMIIFSHERKLREVFQKGIFLNKFSHNLQDKHVLWSSGNCIPPNWPFFKKHGSSLSETDLIVILSLKKILKNKTDSKHSCKWKTFLCTITPVNRLSEGVH